MQVAQRERRAGESDRLAGAVSAATAWLHRGDRRDLRARRKDRFSTGSADAAIAAAKMQLAALARQSIARAA